MAETKSAEITTLEEARKFLNDNFDKGCHCPVCKQYVKLYKRKLTSSMAYALIKIYEYHNNPDNGFGKFFHVEKYFKVVDIPASIRGDFAKLKLWGLIETKISNKKAVPGFYRITPLGIQFVKNAAQVSKIIKIFNNTTFGEIGPDIKITDALGDGFNYKELMNG